MEVPRLYVPMRDGPESSGSINETIGIKLVVKDIFSTFAKSLFLLYFYLGIIRLG